MPTHVIDRRQIEFNDHDMLALLVNNGGQESQLGIPLVSPVGFPRQ